MPKRCVVYKCDSVANAAEGISLHTIPFHGDDRPEAVKRRRRWVNFVKRTRQGWEDSKWSCVCSKHFTADDYEQPLASTSSLPEFSDKFQRTLNHDAFGKVAFPSVYPDRRAVESATTTTDTLDTTDQESRRDKRYVSMKLYSILYILFHI
jgi:hypothetical protein